MNGGLGVDMYCLGLEGIFFDGYELDSFVYYEWCYLEEL